MWFVVVESLNVCCFSVSYHTVRVYCVRWLDATCTDFLTSHTGFVREVASMPPHGALTSLLLPARATWPHSPLLAHAHAAYASLRRKPGVGGGSLQMRSAALCCVMLASVLASDAVRRAAWAGFRRHALSTCHSSRLRRAPPICLPSGHHVTIVVVLPYTMGAELSSRMSVYGHVQLGNCKSLKRG